MERGSWSLGAPACKQESQLPFQVPQQNSWALPGVAQQLSAAEHLTALQAQACQQAETAVTGGARQSVAPSEWTQLPSQQPQQVCCVLPHALPRAVQQLGALHHPSADPVRACLQAQTAPAGAAQAALASNLCVPSQQLQSGCCWQHMPAHFQVPVHPAASPVQPSLQAHTVASPAVLHNRSSTVDVADIYRGPCQTAFKSDDLPILLPTSAPFRAKSCYRRT